MSNHAHIILKIPKEFQVSRSEVAEKYQSCYNKEMHPNSHSCQKLQKQLNDISCFMQRFCWHFSYKFNHKQPFKRTGHLWQGRFHNTNIGDEIALLKCWVYVIFNPVKANMTNSPLQYKFSSMNCLDKDLVDGSLHNFYDVYKKLSENNDLTLDKFKKLLLAILQTELDQWNQKNEQERQLYRSFNHCWDKLVYVDKSLFQT